MRLTTKGRFAVTAMLDLAMHEHVSPITLVAISQRQQISLSYLEQLFGRLRKRSLVKSTRGPKGGYSLMREANQITVAEIILSVDEPLDSTQCNGKEDCGGTPGTPCITHNLWSALNHHMLDFLQSISLQHLVNAQHTKGEGLATQESHPKPISAIQVVKPLHAKGPSSVFTLGVHGEPV